MHYKSEKGLIKSPDFYLSDRGVDDPLLEYQLNLSHFKTDPTYACRFPLRAKFLTETLGIERNPCPEVTEWKKVLGTKSVAIVFVSQYLTNPASIFGHSFLMFQSPRSQGLYYTVSSVADIPAEVGSLEFAYNGLFGGFPSTISVEPFYVKVEEYENIENRDLWIYWLDLNSDEIDFLLDHLWELKKLTQEPYVFTNRNCSVGIYNALAAIRPDVDFIDFPRAYVMPLETVQRMEPLIRSVEYRPSAYKKLSGQVDNLDDQELPRFKEFVKKNKAEVLDTVSELDAALAFYERKRLMNKGELTRGDQGQLQQIQLRRSKLEFPSEKISVIPVSPLSAHSPWLIGTLLHRKDGSDGVQIEISPIYHDLLQASPGYLSYSDLVLLNLKIESSQVNKWEVVNLDFLRMSTYRGKSELEWPLSWSVKIGIDQSESCQNCYHGQGNFLIGKSFGFGEQQMYSLLLGPSLEQDIGVLSSHFRWALNHFPWHMLLDIQLWKKSSELSEFWSSTEFQARVDLTKNSQLTFGVLDFDETVSFQLGVNQSF